MGFGLMFCGYLSLFDLRLFPLELIGFFLLLLGVERLKGYSRYFVYLKYSVYSMLAYSLYYAIAWSLNFFAYSKELFQNVFFATTDSIVYHLLLMVFHIFLYFSLYDISKQCGFQKGMRKTLRNAYIGGLYFTLVLVSLFVPDPNGYFIKLILMTGILWYILNSILLFSCYARIATQEIIDRENEKIAEYDRKHPPKQPFKKQKQKKENSISYRIKEDAPEKESIAYHFKSEKKSK